jgi:membrane protein implicated in regulation of membrane protease activity
MNDVLFKLLWMRSMRSRRIDLDVEKSLEEDRLVGESTVFLFWDTLHIGIAVFFAIWIFVALVAKQPLFNTAQHLTGENLIFQTLLFIFILFVVALGFYQLLYRLLTMDKLKKVRGIDRDRNRAIVHEIVDSAKWRSVIEDDGKVIMDTKSADNHVQAQIVTIKILV